MTAITRTLVITCLVTLCATPLTGVVLAQEAENVVELTNSAATNTAETSPITTATADALWYTLETISGNVELGDFVVGPGRTEIVVSPGETIIQEVSVTNRISDGRTFRLEVEDITGSSDGSSAVSLTGAERGPYSIRDYISFPETEFNLNAGDRARIPVTITVPPDAEPGGYYGSVLVSTVQADGNAPSAAPRQPIVARIGSLFFLTVRGDTVIAGETKSLDLIEDKLWYESGPIELGVLFENTGSVHVNPYGELSITNMMGEEIGFVELEPWFVLPNSLRIREITWDREFLLGRYTATAQVNRGYEDVVDEVSVVFWVLPWKMVGGIFLVLFIIIFTVRAFFRTFEFKRKGD